MKTIEKRISELDKDEITNSLNNKGYTVIKGFIADNECEILKKLYDTGNFRKTVVMERHRYGRGEYKYFDYPLPDLPSAIREQLYPLLSAIANSWMKALKNNTLFPGSHSQLLKQCRDNTQLKPTVLILKYGKGGFNSLHQDIYGDVYFPLQAVLFLSQPDEDYTGGEFVMTEQVPKAQSKPIVLQPKKGDMLIFTTNYRPVKGLKGHYRVTMKHGVSEITGGERYALGIIFHDAVS